MMDKATLIDTLNNKTLVINFKKLDGSERTMKCTRSMTNIPSEHHPKTSLSHDGAIRVFDLEANGWRSFIFENVNSIYE